MDAGEAYRTLAPSVLGYLREQSVPEPEDVLSEVFLQVTRSLPRFKGTEDELRPWIFTIARNRAIDEARRRRRRPVAAQAELPDSEATASPVSTTVDPELLAALARLTAEQREVVVLRFVADLSLEEVARITKRSEGAVKAMQHRALDQLARILRDPDVAVEDDG